MKKCILSNFIGISICDAKIQDVDVNCRLMTNQCCDVTIHISKWLFPVSTWKIRYCMEIKTNAFLEPLVKLTLNKTSMSRRFKWTLVISRPSKLISALKRIVSIPGNKQSNNNKKTQKHLLSFGFSFWHFIWNLHRH